MAAPTATMLSGPVKWSRSGDESGHREYKVSFRVETSDSTAGPAIVATASGLPVPGSQWLIDADYDEWAFCLPNPDIKPDVDGEPNTFWTVEFSFTTKGMPRTQYHDDGSLFPVGNPLLEPAEISVDFTKYTEEATYDRFGLPIRNSAFEPLRGPQNEWDRNRATVKIKLNYPYNPLADSYYDVFLGETVDSISSFLDCVNDATLWNQPARCVKLSAASAEKKYFGIGNVYWALSLTFDIRAPQVQTPTTGGFDRDVLDEGTKVLSGDWKTLPGDGALFDITASGGAVTAAGVASGDGGYPPSTVFNILVVQSGSDNRAVLQVESDATGVITDVLSVVAGGSGYVTAGSLLSEVASKGWVLINIGGEVPDPMNPSHYIRYHGHDGKDTNVILNGGLPTGALTSLGSPPGSGCMVDITVGTAGNIVSAVVNSPGSGYPEDTSIVLYIEGGDGTAQLMFFTDSSGAVESWFAVVWAGTGYSSASGVATSQLTQPGRIHIEKYDQKNLLLLGIPGDLDQLDA